MADLTDVSNALVALVAQTLYPNGTGQPSVAGIGIRIYPGWPNPQQLDSDLKAGIANVSIYPRPEERNTTRYSKDWKPLAVNAPTLTLTINGQQVTVGGTVPTANNPQNVAVIANGQSFTYVATLSDTLTGIATALSALISSGIPGTTNAGPIITLPNTARISATRIGTNGTMIRELRRQERLFQITTWSDTPDHRDAVVKPTDVALAATPFMTLIDQSAARMIYKGSPITDQYQKDKLYRRDLFYTVEYATTQTIDGTQVITEQITIAPQTYNGGQISSVQVNL
jgi:hypothetical protein